MANKNRAKTTSESVTMVMQSNHVLCSVNKLNPLLKRIPRNVYSTLYVTSSQTKTSSNFNKKNRLGKSPLNKTNKMPNICRSNVRPPSNMLYNTVLYNTSLKYLEKLLVIITF